MAGGTVSRIGSHLTSTEPVIQVTAGPAPTPALTSGTPTTTQPVASSAALTAAEMQAITRTEGQRSIDVLNEQLVELKTISLGMKVVTEEELEADE